MFLKNLKKLTTNKNFKYFFRLIKVDLKNFKIFGFFGKYSHKWHSHILKKGLATMFMFKLKFVVRLF